MSAKNIQVCLARRPDGGPKVEDFSIQETEIPSIRDGQILVRHSHMSLDPYMVGRMRDEKSYAVSVGIGEVMGAHTIGTVVESKDAGYAPGDKVAIYGGWQLYGISRAADARKLDPRVPDTAHLSALGMPGATAYVGMTDICQPKAGETVVVSAAAGAVGSMTGQIAKIRGARVVGIAGGAEKCRLVTEHFGFDACVDYKSPSFAADLAAATPKGIDAVFENVGGAVMDECLKRLNPFARIAICGLISQYSATEQYGMRNIRSLLVNRVHVKGFIVSDHLDRWPAAFADMGTWLASGQLKIVETIDHGIRNAPKIFIGMLNGANKGKQIVQLID